MIHTPDSENNKTQLRTWKNQTKKLLNQHENESIRCSSSSDSNFQLQRRHSDSICSSWDDAQQILTATSSSGRGSSSSANRYFWFALRQTIPFTILFYDCSMSWIRPENNSNSINFAQFLKLIRLFFPNISLNFFALLRFDFCSSDNSIGHDVIIPIEVQTLLATSTRDSGHLLTPPSNDDASANASIDSVAVANATTCNGHIESNLAMQQPSLISVDNAKDATTDEKDIMLEWHRNKPSIWQQYYGSKRLKYSSMVKKIKGKFDVNPTMAMSYVSVNISM